MSIESIKKLVKEKMEEENARTHEEGKEEEKESGEEEVTE